MGADKGINWIGSDWIADVRAGIAECGLDVSAVVSYRGRNMLMDEYSKSLLKAMGNHALEHYRSCSYGVYPIENDSAIAIVLVANRYSPNNFW